MGCRLNIAESEAMRGLAHDRDDLVIVNSCAVTAEAVKQTRQAIRRARRARPDARIIVTGCAADTEPQTFMAMAEVDEVLPNRDKLAFVPGAAPIAAFTEHARAFVEVQNGCDHDCTFCIIPLGRGKSRSIAAGPLIERIAALVESGHREVVLTGVDVTSYGTDLPGRPSLGQLVERILHHVPSLPRLRLSSLDSVEIDDRLFEIITGEPRVMPHLHLSLQAGDDMILKRMKRRHNRADAIRIVERLKAKRPEIAIGADIIAGFPTEDEAMFANSLRLVEECDIVHGHVFPYSPRPGTPAARMPQVDPAIVKDRARRLRAACDAQKARWLDSLVGTTQRVLVELSGDKGHAENFASVRVAAHPRESSNAVVDVIITARQAHTLTGTLS
jgi:threonylcarbamoyladenosine tRNA methylthiotransferase MtaB